MSLIPFPPDILSTAAFGGGAGAVFWAVRWFFEWLGGRWDRRQEVIDSKTDRLIERLETRVDQLQERLSAAEVDLAECKKLHIVAEGELTRLKLLGYSNCPHREICFKDLLPPITS